MLPSSCKKCTRLANSEAVRKEEDMLGRCALGATSRSRHWIRVVGVPYWQRFFGFKALRYKFVRRWVHEIFTFAWKLFAAFENVTQRQDLVSQSARFIRLRKLLPSSFFLGPALATTQSSRIQTHSHACGHYPNVGSCPLAIDASANPILCSPYHQTTCFNHGGGERYGCKVERDGCQCAIQSFRRSF